MITGIVGLAAIVLTVTMFATRNSMLGFPSAIFWAIFGGYCYTQSTATWDIYYFVFIASVLGMTVFSIYAAFGLREKHDTVADEDMEKGETQYVDEEKPESSDNGNKPSVRTRQLRERAEKRRTGESRREKADWGEFR